MNLILKKTKRVLAVALALTLMLSFLTIGAMGAAAPEERTLVGYVLDEGTRLVYVDFEELSLQFARASVGLPGNTLLYDYYAGVIASEAGKLVAYVYETDAGLEFISFLKMSEAFVNAWLLTGDAEAAMAAALAVRDFAFEEDYEEGVLIYEANANGIVGATPVYEVTADGNAEPYVNGEDPIDPEEPLEPGHPALSGMVLLEAGIWAARFDMDNERALFPFEFYYNAPAGILYYQLPGEGPYTTASARTSVVRDPEGREEFDYPEMEAFLMSFEEGSRFHLDTNGRVRTVSMKGDTAARGGGGGRAGNLAIDRSIVARDLTLELVGSVTVTGSAYHITYARSLQSQVSPIANNRNLTIAADMTDHDLTVAAAVHRLSDTILMTDTIRDVEINNGTLSAANFPVPAAQLTSRTINRDLRIVNGRVIGIPNSTATPIINVTRHATFNHVILGAADIGTVGGNLLIDAIRNDNNITTGAVTENATIIYEAVSFGNILTNGNLLAFRDPPADLSERTVSDRSAIVSINGNVSGDVTVTYGSYTVGDIQQDIPGNRSSFGNVRIGPVAPPTATPPLNLPLGIVSGNLTVNYGDVTMGNVGQVVGGVTTPRSPTITYGTVFVGRPDPTSGPRSGEVGGTVSINVGNLTTGSIITSVANPGTTTVNYGQVNIGADSGTATTVGTTNGVVKGDLNLTVGNANTGGISNGGAVELNYPDVIIRGPATGSVARVEGDVNIDFGLLNNGTRAFDRIQPAPGPKNNVNILTVGGNVNINAPSYWYDFTFESVLKNVGITGLRDAAFVRFGGIAGDLSVVGPTVWGTVNVGRPPLSGSLDGNLTVSRIANTASVSVASVIGADADVNLEGGGTVRIGEIHTTRGQVRFAGGTIVVDWMSPLIRPRISGGNVTLSSESFTVFDVRQADYFVAGLGVSDGAVRAGTTPVFSQGTGTASATATYSLMGGFSLSGVTGNGVVSWTLQTLARATGAPPIAQEVGRISAYVENGIVIMIHVVYVDAPADGPETPIPDGPGSDVGFGLASGAAAGTGIGRRFNNGPVTDDNIPVNQYRISGGILAVGTPSGTVRIEVTDPISIAFFQVLREEGTVIEVQNGVITAVGSPANGNVTLINEYRAQKLTWFKQTAGTLMLHGELRDLNLDGTGTIEVWGAGGTIDVWTGNSPLHVSFATATSVARINIDGGARTTGQQVITLGDNAKNVQVLGEISGTGVRIVVGNFDGASINIGRWNHGNALVIDYSAMTATPTSLTISTMATGSSLLLPAPSGAIAVPVATTTSLGNGYSIFATGGGVTISAAGMLEFTIPGAVVTIRRED